MSAFVREWRYIVIKAKDMQAYLSDEEQRELNVLLLKISMGRNAAGKLPVEAVVVEHDWPEYEPTWAAIEARCAAEDAARAG